MREWEAGRAVGEKRTPRHRARRSRNSAEPGVQPQAAGSGNLQLLVSACACPSDPFCSRFSRGCLSLGRRRAGGRIAGSLVSATCRCSAGGNKAEFNGRSLKAAAGGAGCGEAAELSSAPGHGAALGCLGAPTFPLAVSVSRGDVLRATES